MSEHNVLTVSFKPPKWMKTVWAKMNWGWLESDDGYQLFFKLLGFAVAAPVAAGITTALYTGASFLFATGVIFLFALMIVFMWGADRPFGTARWVFWGWLTVALVWYVASFVGMIEIAVATALFG